MAMLPMLPLVRHPLQTARYVKDTGQLSLSTAIITSTHANKAEMLKVLAERQAKGGTLPIGVVGAPSEFAIVFT